MVAQVLAAPLVVVTSNITPPHSHAVASKTEFVGKMRKGLCGKPGSHHSLDDGKVRIFPFIGTFAPVHGTAKIWKELKSLVSKHPMIVTTMDTTTLKAVTTTTHTMAKAY
jgi:hypothetical protein